MVKAARVLAIATFLIGAFVTALATPNVLVVQVLTPGERDYNPNVGITAILADEFDQTGRVKTIVWSLNDPVFRAAVESKIIDGLTQNPTQKMAFEAAAKLGCQYVFVVTAIREGKLVRGLGVLFETDGEKRIWKDEQTSGVMVGSGVDWESSARTIGRKWTYELESGPWKKHPGRVGQLTPPLKDPVVDELAGIAPERGVESMVKAETQMKSGDLHAAISLLREVIDAHPSEIKPREMLLQAYLQANFTEQAASEARRLLQISPDKVEVRLLAARAWLACGKLDEAQRDVNESLARDPANPEVQEMAGNIALAKGDPSRAIEAFSTALDKKELFGARLGRSLAYAVLGEPEKSSKDLNKLPIGTDLERKTFYQRAVRTIDSIVPNLGGEVRDLIQLARVRAKEPKTVELAKQIERKCRGLAEFFASLPVPSAHQKSHGKRVLAHKLLAQAAGEAAVVANEGDEDMAAEASISLGEALKAFPALRAEYESEILAKHS